MSALSQSGPAGDLFHKSGGVFGSFEYDQKESRSSYDISSKKKRPAPQPPSGLGQYKPRILNLESSGGVPVIQNGDSPVAPPRPSKGRGTSNSDVGNTRPIVMGDKDVPMVLASSQDPQDLDLNVSNLNLTSHDVLDQDRDIGTDNPLFSMHDSTSAEQHDEDVQPDDTDNKTDDKESEGIYIPVPDYEEEEVMMTMPEELEVDYPTNPSRRTQIYKEYDGEDFGQYLSDEEGGPTDIYRCQPIPSHTVDRKSKTEAKRTVKNKKNHNTSGFSSLRDFSYADSKYGKTKGHKKHHSLSSGPANSKDAETFINTGASYEQFLRSKNGVDVGQMESCHTYREEDSTDRASYVDKVHNKESVWKRLTWKAKKHGNSFDLTASS